MGVVIPLPARPFASTAEAWFWTMGALLTRNSGARPVTIGRPCEPDDVVKELDHLYRRRRIELAHARILRIYGERGRAPNPAYPPERGDARLWDEAITALGLRLRMRGIVA